MLKQNICRTMAGVTVMERRIGLDGGSRAGVRGYVCMSAPSRSPVDSAWVLPTLVM